MTTDSERSRRQFLFTATAAGGGLLAAGIGGTVYADEPAKPKSGTQAAEDISPPEDLMREHGVLNRILLIYDEWLRQRRMRWKPRNRPACRRGKDHPHVHRGLSRKAGRRSSVSTLREGGQARRTGENVAGATSGGPPIDRANHPDGDPSGDGSHGRTREGLIRSLRHFIACIARTRPGRIRCSFPRFAA